MYILTLSVLACYKQIILSWYKADKDKLSHSKNVLSIPVAKTSITNEMLFLIAASGIIPVSEVYLP